jgi:DNA-binding beta-propeller fold protein YncE
MKKLIAVVLLAAAAFAAEGYKVLNKIKIGGTGSWDYVTLDNGARRLYVSHGATVAVVDPDAGKVVGTISELHGVHGIAVAADLNKGFITNGQSNSVTIFDLKTLAKSGEPAVGGNPDSVCYEPKTQRIFTFNGRSNDSTVLNAKTGEVVGTVALGGKPEFCQVDGAGKLYVNNETTSEVIEIDAAKPAMARRVSILPCEGPSGLAIDLKGKKLFSVCDGTMAVTDIATMKVVATPKIGARPDGAGFDPDLGLAFSSNGAGTMSIVKLVNGKYETVDTVTTEAGGRTMTVDPKTHRVYILAAEYGAPPAGGGRAQTVPDSFHVLVVGK